MIDGLIGAALLIIGATAVATGLRSSPAMRGAVLRVAGLLAVLAFIAVLISAARLVR